MRSSILLLSLLIIAGCTNGNDLPARENTYISFKSSEGSMALVSGEEAADIWIGEGTQRGVVMALENLKADVERVTGICPLLREPGQVSRDLEAGTPGRETGIILAGTIGSNSLVDQLVESGKLDVSEIKGKWEASLTTVMDDPFPGIARALVIAGSDMRGTIYGIYECSAQMGVSPWYFWADVAPIHRNEIHVIPGTYVIGEPAVKYRGIFINDEAPALAGWVHENYGAFNHEFYAYVFELILRMRGNYLWPAMWGRAFYDDDTLNAPLADACGVVIGTTHHEPLMRAHVEWSRYGNGPWDYTRNADTLRKFWREGMERMDGYESIVSIGMRGDGDAPMTQGTAISLLERIVADQRQIIEEVTGKDPSETPQLWALYKEVQEYYDQGMRVPEDVTLLLCDDNWGNIRKLPDPGAPGRKGGYGIYYHFDYVGGPRNYKWLNTNQIERVWEQMNLACSYGADRIWIVNVGDIKPMELPIQFFLDMAWEPGRFNPGNLEDYYTYWAAQQFGPDRAPEIGQILATYTKFNARRKPELLSPETYSLHWYHEAERVVKDYRELARLAEDLYGEVDESLKDAFFQLVLFPVEACANLNDLYVTAAKNHLYATQGRASTNQMARRARELFEADREWTRRFHEDMAGGKWNHMMSQTHIGYTYWQEPRQNNIPELIEITVPEEGRMGLALEGSLEAWPGSGEAPVLPAYDAAGRQEYFIEVFNRGSEAFPCTITPSESWIIPDRDRFTVEGDRRVGLRVDWNKVPEGLHRIPVEISGGGATVTVMAVVDNRAQDLAGAPPHTFLESGGVVSMEAAHFVKAVEAGGIGWEVVPNLGRTLSSVISVPVTAGATEPGEGAPCLEYSFLVRDSGRVQVAVFLSPTLDFRDSGGFRFALSVDQGDPVMVNMHDPDNPRTWERWVADNIIVKTTEFRIPEAGIHDLRFWRIDPAVVLQKIEIRTGAYHTDAYLGAPESPRISP
jgi:hypothetical protein